MTEKEKIETMSHEELQAYAHYQFLLAFKLDNDICELKTLAEMVKGAAKMFFSAYTFDETPLPSASLDNDAWNWVNGYEHVKWLFDVSYEYIDKIITTMTEILEFNLEQSTQTMALEPL